MFTTQILKPSGEAITLEISPGQTVFVVGANGTGKSSLMHRFFSTHSMRAHRISAHRQTWFSSNAVTLSPEQKRQTENQIQQQDTNSEARWKDDQSSQRASIAIYDLIDAENVRARAIASAVTKGNMTIAQELAKKDAPLAIINELLKQSNIPIEISVHQNDQVVASRFGGPIYSVAELSDGERNALLIAAKVLTVPPNTLLLIDEPERHLHRSIISPLLTQLFERRSDCAFIVSTHDISLPVDSPFARTLLIRECKYEHKAVTHWDAELFESTDAIDEKLKTEILGSRKNLIFVEGKVGSLDAPLYSLLFPRASIIPKATCREVMNAVTGIRNATALHWVAAFGVIDRDGRTAEEVSQLQARGIYALDVFSVESIYYHPEIQQRIATKQAFVQGNDPNQQIQTAKEHAIAEIKIHSKRLSERVVEHRLRNEVEKCMPTNQSISDGTPINVVIDVQSKVATEVACCEALANDQKLVELISRYPIRETGALAKISSCLGFQTRHQYEAAVRKLLVDDQSAVNFVQGLFSGLPQVIK